MKGPSERDHIPQGADGATGRHKKKQARRSSSPETLPAPVIPVQGTPPVPRAPPASAGSDAIPGHDRRPYAWEAHGPSRHLVGEDTLCPLQFQACLAASVVGNVSSSDLGHARRVRGSLLYASGLVNGDQLNRGQEREGGGTTASLFLHKPQHRTNWPGTWPTLCGSWLEPTMLCRSSKAANSVSSGSSMEGHPDKRRFICSWWPIVPRSSGQRPSKHQSPMSPRGTSPAGVVSGVPMGKG